MEIYKFNCDFFLILFNCLDKITIDNCKDPFQLMIDLLFYLPAYRMNQG